MEDWNTALLLLFWCFTTLWYFSGHFGHSQLTYPNCSWASLLGSLPVLSAHSFASNWQLPFLNKRKGENGRRNYFMTKLHERMLPDVRIEPRTVHIPGGRASDRVTASSTALLKLIQSQEDIFCYLSYHIVPLLKKQCSSKIMRNLLLPYGNNKGANQPAHPCSLISTFVIRCLDRIISLVSTSKFQASN